MKKLVLWFLVGVLAVCSPLYIHAEEAAAGMGDTADVHTVTTQHTAMIDGEELAYTAVTGSYTLTSGGSQCELYFTAYTKDGVEDMASRPVTFAFNGGPGSASVWLHMGILGPRRVNLDGTGKPRSLPARLTDNAYSILDMTDIVMIEPVGTGYSHALEGYDEKDFLGYENDNRTVGDFIRLYVNRNARWSSPKYLIGESYGTVRAVGVCDYLYKNFSMGLNGLILVSAANDYECLEDEGGMSGLSNVLILPSFAAAAWYHQRLESSYQEMALEDFLAEVRSFAENEYLTGLFKGSALSPEEKAAMAEKLARYTGLRKEDILRRNFRIDIDTFCSELLAKEGLMVGRIDARYTGPVTSGHLEEGGSDPSMTTLDSIFSSALNHYLMEELGFQTDRPYILSSLRVNQAWTWMGENQYLNQEKIMYENISKNRFLKVWEICGYYDLATPFFGNEWIVNHLFLDEEHRDQVHFSYYPSGHMFYMNEASCAAFHEEAEQWYAQP